MAVTFVIGRAGSGKTSRCFSSIVNSMRVDPLGPPIWWILPRQATFTAERELTCASGLSGFCRTRVVSFESLGREVIASTGGSSIPEVTPLGRQLILGHLVRRLQPQLRFFASVAHQAGLAAELDSTFAELERSGKNGADLGALIADLETAKPANLDAASLLAKLRDLRLIYDAYGNFLGQDRLDQHRRLAQVLDCVARCELFRNATAYVDGFVDFTAHERQLLAGVCKACQKVEIALTIDPASRTLRDPHVLPDDLSLFHRTEEAYRRLWFTFNEEGVTVAEAALLEESHRFKSRALASIEELAFGGSTRVCEDPNGLTLVAAPDRRAEVDAAAREIRSLLRQGHRLREVGVLVRDLESYHALVDSSFREHGIPYFVDRRRTATHHPLLQLVRSLLQIARHDWPHDAVMSLLKSGLAGLPLYDADALENYVLQHRIRGGVAWEMVEPWNFRRALTAGEDADTPAADESARIDAMRRRLVAALLPLISGLRRDGTLPVGEIVTGLFETLERLVVRQTLGAWAEASKAAANLEQGSEHEQVWSELVGLFDQMVELLGTEAVEAADFVDILEAGLERFDLALTPPTVDQVLVGQVDRTRAPELRAVLGLGLNAGEFPRASRETSMLSDPERRELRSRRLDLEPDVRRRTLDESLLGYTAFTRASERLYLSRPLSDDDGKPAEPSAFWERVLEMFPSVTVTQVPREDDDPRYIDTPRQLVVSLMRWVRRGAASHTDSESLWPALYQWLATYPRDGDAMDMMRFRAWRALGYTNEAQLSAEVARQVFPSPLPVSVSTLETIAACPFRNFLRQGLGLSQRESPDVTSLDLGRLYHQVLEILVGDLFDRKGTWDAEKPPVSRESIKRYAQEIGKTLRGELMMSSARNQYLLGRVERTLEQVVAAQHAILRRGSFRPKSTGVAFGGARPKVPALRLRTPKGAELVLDGQIDRVDVVEEGGGFAVIDYRMTAAPLSLGRAYHGLSLQLLTYLLVLQAHGQELTGQALTPAAAFYVQLLRRIDDVAHPDDAGDPTDPNFHLKVKPRGIIDERFLAAIDPHLNEGQSDVVQVHVKKDGDFGHRGTSDVADAQEFDSLLALVRRRLGELADRMLAGEIGISPYRMNRQTPCPNCEYRGVCRFETTLNHYHHLPSLSRSGVLQKLAQATNGR